MSSTASTTLDLDYDMCTVNEEKTKERNDAISIEDACSDEEFAIAVHRSLNDSETDGMQEEPKEPKKPASTTDSEAPEKTPADADTSGDEALARALQRSMNAISSAAAATATLSPKDADVLSLAKRIETSDKITGASMLALIRAVLRKMKQWGKLDNDKRIRETDVCVRDATSFLKTLEETGEDIRSKALALEDAKTPEDVEALKRLLQRHEALTAVRLHMIKVRAWLERLAAVLREIRQCETAGELRTLWLKHPYEKNASRINSEAPLDHKTTTVVEAAFREKMSDLIRFYGMRMRDPANVNVNANGKRPRPADIAKAAVVAEPAAEPARKRAKRDEEQQASTRFGNRRLTAIATMAHKVATTGSAAERKAANDTLAIALEALARK